MNPVASVGIFWFVPTKGDRSQILFDATPLERAVPYGDCLTHEEGHAEFWERLARMGVTWLRRADYPPAPATSEYDEWPRGRVVFEVRVGRFVIYADRRLHGRAFLGQIRSAFGIATGYTVRSDSHYRRSGAVGQPITGQRRP